jgi:hypothetical protein
VSRTGDRHWGGNRRIQIRRNSTASSWPQMPKKPVVLTEISDDRETERHYLTMEAR